MIKKAILMVFVFVLLVSAAFGGCKTSRDTIMYLDADRFMAVDRVCNVSPKQGEQMMYADVRDGIAAAIPKGTSLKIEKYINEYITLVSINEVYLIAFTGSYSCN